MLNRKLLEIIKRLDKVEIKRLRQFLQSPYFTYGLSNQEIIKIFDLIVRYEADERLPVLDKRRVSAKLFPDKPYRENEKNPVDTLTSDLLRLVKKFLFVESAENDTAEAMKELPLARFYRRFGLEERFWNSIHGIRNALDAETSRGDTYFLNRYYVEEEVSTFKSLYNFSEDDVNIGVKAQFLENFFAITRIDIACSMNLQQQRVEFNPAYSPALSEELVRLIRNETFQENELLTVYLLVFDIINDPHNLGMVDQLEEELEKRKDKLPMAHLKNLMAYLRIFIVRRFQTNDQNQYLANYFELITRHLDAGYLYFEDKMLASSLRNITHNGLRLGAYDKVRDILKNHPPERIGATRHPNEMHNLNWAMYYLALGEYDKAEQHLGYCNFDNVYFSVQAEMLRIKIYVETNNDLLEWRVKALQQKIRRSKMVKDHKERYFNLLNKILLISKYAWDKSNPKCARLAEEIRNTPGLLEKEWLLNQLK